MFVSQVNFPNATEWWTSGSDSMTDNVWKWEGDGQNIAYKAWESEPERDKFKNYLTLTRKASSNVYVCRQKTPKDNDHRLPYICEMKFYAGECSFLV